MSLLRLTLTRPPAPATHLLPALRSCPLRPQLLRKSLPPHSLRRPFASSAPPPRSHHGSGTAATTPTASKPATASSGTTAQLLPERLLVYQAGTGRIGFVAGLKITTIFVAAVFALVWEPAMLRSDDVSVAQITAACKSPHSFLPAHHIGFLPRPTCALIPFAYVAYFSAPFVTHVFLRLPPAARSSRALLERYVRALPATAQLEVGTLGLAGRPRATLVSAADLRPVPADAGFRETRARLVTHTRDVADLMARKKWYHYRPVSLFGLPAKEAGRASKSSGYRNAAKDAWVYDIIRPMLGQRR
ncbi:hypothetical protein CGGC5_v012463 [Colletotrichum fructicola Nara gc5]|uniref:Uncharacterized protein n=2 Tax=Colletotrichum fructicola (strain Nara gc5) TaxID=1213859 RepID=A0A7J6IQE1_COLFN|nr:hypothetical protein CFRS1_v001037 [Colletotrichum fructicola]KAF4479126.1 hypothetical protein CGGC5_v012463 [Colletotrichum fructicola Nara gc5]KAF5490358.1 hypothetical protein CGCF413_v011403 [Colletotrichum fructicola]KAI8278388.1 hypothetical protein K4K60_006344 [Colletotrichum sp. SAR11_57]